MELYPAHRLFLACDTAVYALVVNGRCGTVAGCLAQLQRWLSLIRSALVPGSLKVAARIVVSHTDALTASERTALLQEVHDRVLATFGEHFDFGERCYATLYSAAAGSSDVDALRDELLRLRRCTAVALPTSYLEVCDDVLKMARERRRWPVVPLSLIDTRGERGVLAALEDLGFLRRADDLVILEPVTWLSHMMAATPRATLPTCVAGWLMKPTARACCRCCRGSTYAFPSLKGATSFPR
jgi:hypothetical protein